MRRIGTETHDRERGQIVVLFALVMVVLMAFASLVVDVGVLRNDRQTLVNAMDSGALAGGTLLPVDGAVPADVTRINNLINTTVQANFPSLPSSGYTIEYKCLIGVDTSNPPQPFISRDIPAVCDPRPSLGRNPVAADFHGAGSTRFMDCHPERGDRCNVVVVSGAANTPYSFGRVVGVNSGSTGTVTSAACNGPCGEPPFSPVDVALVIDRTGSMSGQEANLRNAASAVLLDYDPNVQHVALGMLGPSTLTSTCAGSPSVHANPLSVLTQSPPTYQTASSATNVAGGASSLVITKPAGTTSGDFLIAGIAVHGGSTPTITAPAGWTLARARTNNGTNVALATYYKVAGGAEPASYSWTLPNTTRASGGILRYSGVDPSSPIDSSSTATGSGTSVTATGITTASNNTALVGFFGTDTGTTFTAPGGASAMNEEFDVRNTNAAGPSTEAAVRTQPTSGATGNKSATAAASAQWAAQLVALRAAPVVQEYGTSTTTDMTKWMTVGLTGTVSTGTPPPVNERYVNTNGTLNTSSQIVKAINCFSLSGTGTNLATPMDMARAYLLANGRAGVRKGIIFETDGTPNLGGTSDPANYTCAAAQAAATTAKAAGIEVFTIGFGVTGQNCPDGGAPVTNLLANMSTGPNLGSSLCDANENKDGDHFFCQPDGADLRSVFQQAAQALANQRSHLVSLYPIPVVTAIGPSTGSAGAVVTVTGLYFTGVTQVEFGGAAATFTLLSDTSIRVTAPAGVSGRTVDITVQTPGGSSPVVSADRFTYN